MSEFETPQAREAEDALHRLLRWQTEGHPSPGSLDALEDIARLRPFLERAELDAVRRCRQDGVSWAEIATRLGVSRQSAWEKWRDIHPDPAAGRRQRTRGSRRTLVKVPSLRGLTYPQAALRLEREGLVAVDEHGLEHSPEAPPAGRVTAHAPETGARVDTGSHVRLVMRDDGGASDLTPPPGEPAPRAAWGLAEPPPEQLFEMASSTRADFGEDPDGP